MNLTKKTAILAAAVFATLLGSSAVANSQWQIDEFDFVNPAEYVSCLGEHVSAHVWVTIRYREFETPSGTSHYIEYYTWDAEWIGQLTGNVWISYGRSPGSFHGGKGEVGQWNSRELAIPVVGGWPQVSIQPEIQIYVQRERRFESVL